MFDEGQRFGRMEGRRATKRSVNYPTLDTTQPARMGHPQKETRGKIKACPTRQRPWPTPGHCYCVSGLDRGQKAGRDTRPAKKSDGAAMGRLRELWMKIRRSGGVQARGMAEAGFANAGAAVRVWRDVENDVVRTLGIARNSANRRQRVGGG